MREKGEISPEQKVQGVVAFEKMEHIFSSTVLFV